MILKPLGVTGLVLGGFLVGRMDYRLSPEQVEDSVARVVERQSVRDKFDLYADLNGNSDGFTSSNERVELASKYATATFFPMESWDLSSHPRNPNSISLLAQREAVASYEMERDNE